MPATSQPPHRRPERLLALDRRQDGLVERAELVAITCGACGGALGAVVAGAELWCAGCRLLVGADDAPPRPGMDG